MTALPRKTRTISLRLSEQEFDAVKSLYAAYGARSISEFARAAMKAVMSSAKRDTVALELEVQEMGSKLGALDREVARLVRRIETELAWRAKRGEQND